jgi:hypothetical protein
MSAIIQLDEQRRGVFPEPFKPGDTLVVDRLGSETISMHLLQPAEVPTVEPRRIKGRLFGAKVELNRREVAAAVRADRDSSANELEHPAPED